MLFNFVMHLTDTTSHFNRPFYVSKYLHIHWFILILVQYFKKNHFCGGGRINIITFILLKRKQTTTGDLLLHYGIRQKMRRPSHLVLDS
jgi:hypothetical protein